MEALQVNEAGVDLEAVAKRVVAGIQAYSNGGPDEREQWRADCKAYGLPEEELEKGIAKAESERLAFFWDLIDKRWPGDVDEKIASLEDYKAKLVPKEEPVRVEVKPRPKPSLEQQLWGWNADGYVPQPSSLAPGIVGEIGEYVLANSLYPSRALAVVPGLATVGTLVGQRVAGPSGAKGTGTHNYYIIVAPTGAGKEGLRTCTKDLFAGCEARQRIGPGRFKSGPGVVKHLTLKSCSLCIMDEFGSFLSRITDDRAGGYEKEISEVFREVWGINFGQYDSAQGANDDSVIVENPQLSLLCLTTEDEFYAACKNKEVTNGFLNRLVVIQERHRQPYRKVGAEACIVPASLITGLKRLYGNLLNHGSKPIMLSWGPGAEAAFDAIRDEVASLADEQELTLRWRSAEKTVRIATVLACGRFDTKVLRSDMEWADKLVRKADAALLGGVKEHLIEGQLRMAELYRDIIARLKGKRDEKGYAWLPKWQLMRSFQNNSRKDHIDEALAFLMESRQIEAWHDEETGGRPAWKYRACE